MVKMLTNRKVLVSAFDLVVSSLCSTDVNRTLLSSHNLSAVILFYFPREMRRNRWRNAMRRVFLLSKDNSSEECLKRYCNQRAYHLVDAMLSTSDFICCCRGSWPSIVSSSAEEKVSKSCYKKPVNGQWQRSNPRFLTICPNLTSIDFWRSVIMIRA